ncbi:MAG TPA: hypothetical protein DCG06_05345 [Deltaproteobacteria bacterium]|nr:hypothetical protein [Deltaproteobacteria bacterium]
MFSGPDGLQLCRGIAIEMSRSFVRSWATVVTIMALACFAFVQPMPEGPAGGGFAGNSGSELSKESSGETGSLRAGSHLNEAPPLLDTAFSSKTFSSVAILPVMIASHIGGTGSNTQAFAAAKIPTRAPEPLIRPG